MSNTDLKKLNLEERGLKAYINQQVSEVAAKLGAKAAVTMKVDQLEKEYVATMQLKHKLGEIASNGRSTDLFSAISEAKENLLAGIIEIEDAISPEVRASKIAQITSGNLYLH